MRSRHTSELSLNHVLQIEREDFEDNIRCLEKLMVPEVEFYSTTIVPL
jgi:hypothetical protein